jgi:hypothetical protein
VGLKKVILRNKPSSYVPKNYCTGKGQPSRSTTLPGIQPGRDLLEILACISFILWSRKQKVGEFDNGLVSRQDQYK